MVFPCLNMITLSLFVHPEILTNAGFEDPWTPDSHYERGDNTFEVYTGRTADDEGNPLYTVVVTKVLPNGEPVEFYFGTFNGPEYFKTDHHLMKKFDAKILDLVTEENKLEDPNDLEGEIIRQVLGSAHAYSYTGHAYPDPELDMED